MLLRLLPGSSKNTNTSSSTDNTTATPAIQEVNMLEEGPYKSAALAGLIFVALIGWRLIPTRGGGAAEAAEALAEYIAELTVPEGSPHITKRLA